MEETQLEAGACKMLCHLKQLNKYTLYHVDVDLGAFRTLLLKYWFNLDLLVVV